MIQIDHLTKEFSPNLRAVDDISLHVRAGEVFSFLGPNGAGKTTTIKILITLLHPTSGTATVAGHDVIEDPLSVRMSFGYVGQQSGVDPALTVSENLVLQGHLYHLPKKKIEERIQFLLDLFNMGGREGQWVGALSGGLKRRLDIATALIHEPKLIFLDEPTLGLDPKGRSDLWTYIRRLNQDHGMTVFLTTHYLDEVDQLADRVGILDMGRIRIIGTPDELKDSLGADAIQLSFSSSPEKETLALFHKKSWFKEVIHQGKELRLYLEDGRQRLPEVIQWLDEHKLSPHSVLLARPSFDDVYLKYTGKNWSLSEEKSEEQWGSWGGSGAGQWKNKWQKGNAQEGKAQTEENWEKQLENKEGQPEGSWENKWQHDDKKPEEAWEDKNPKEEDETKGDWKNKCQDQGMKSDGDWETKWQQGEVSIENKENKWKKEQDPSQEKWPSDKGSDTKGKG